MLWASKIKMFWWGFPSCQDYISSDYCCCLYLEYKITASVDFGLRTHLFCSSNFASSSSSSGLKFSESAGDSAGADRAASWEEESGLSTGLPVDRGSWSMPDGEEGHSKWGSAPAEASLSGLQLGMDMALELGGTWLSWETAWLKEWMIRGLQICREARKQPMETGWLERSTDPNLQPCLLDVWPHRRQRNG